MTVTAAQRDFLKAFTLGDSQRTAELNAQIPADERDSLPLFVAAFFDVMLDQHFSATAGPAEVRAFAEEMRHDYPDLDTPVDVATVETLVNASRSETQPVDEIPEAESFRAELLVIGKILVQNPSLRSDVDVYLADAQARCDA